MGVGPIFAHYRLACERPGGVAGVGSVAGAMVLDQCQPEEGVPVIEIHGTAAPLVPYEGGVVPPEVATEPAPPTRAMVERWASINGCLDEPEEETEVPVSTLTWKDCWGGAAVKLVTIEGGGHTWFAEGLGPANGAVDAASLIWDFFNSLAKATDE